ncbi:MAG: tetratricopeptide repeat protein, partial [Acidobacteria bacterium]|nr:tetratricopeptide repeat protein [Acidobacteriota bacterium]
AYRDLGDSAKAEAHLAKKGDGEVRLAEPLMAVIQGLSVGQQKFRQEGQKAFQEKRFEDAVQAYGRAVAADPLFADLRVSLAAALVQVGKPAEALEQYELATKIAPAHPRANFGAAFLLQRSGQNAQAAERYRRVLAVEPNNRNAHVNLAQTFFEQEDYPAALAEIDQVLANDPKDVPMRLARVGALIAQKRYFDAESTLDEGLALDGKDPQLLQAQARLLATSPQAEQRDGGKAVELAETLVNLEKRPEHVETLAMALAGAGRFEEAIVLQQALIESAKAAERKGLEDALTATLERYRAGLPALPPWEKGGPRIEGSGS